MKDLVFMLELIVMTSFSIIYCTGFDELQPVPQTSITVSGEQLEIEAEGIESKDNESGEKAEEKSGGDPPGGCGKAAGKRSVADYSNDIVFLAVQISRSGNTDSSRY